jgi:hypothetical protein
MCTRCGRMPCGGCYDQVEGMCPPGTPTEHNKLVGKDPQLHNFRASATGEIFQTPKDFRPTTRFTLNELQTTANDMTTVIGETSPPAPPTGTSSGLGSAHIVDLAARSLSWNPPSPPESTEPPALSSASSLHDDDSIVRVTPNLQP